MVLAYQEQNKPIPARSSLFEQLPMEVHGVG